MEKRVRILVAKPGLDGHDRGEQASFVLISQSPLSLPLPSTIHHPPFTIHPSCATSKRHHRP